MKKYRIRILAAALIPALLGGCSAEKLQSTMAEWMPEVKPGQTISSDSKWINSDVAGAVDESVTVSEKDDFYTAVNLDWLRDTEVDAEDVNGAGTFTDAYEVLSEQNKALLTPANLAVDESIMSQEAYEHLEEITSTLTGLLGNWEKRNELGAEPIRKYVEELSAVTTLDELTDCLLEEGGRPQSAMDLVSFYVAMDVENRDQYAVLIGPGSSWLLSGQSSYSSFSSTDVLMKSDNEEAASYVLGMLGYSEQEIRSILKNGYRLESRLAENELSTDTQGGESYEADTSLDLEKIRALQGNYPLTEILEKYGLEQSELFSVYDTDYLRAVGKIYSEQRLEELKSYFILQTVITSLPYLDEKCYEIYLDRKAALSQTESAQASDEEETPTDPIPGENEENSSEEESGSVSSDEEMIQTFAEGLIGDVLEELYIARYCTAEDKEGLYELTEEMLEYYREMLLSEEWLSEETRQKAVEKLDAMTVRILYPDHLTDFSGLCLDKDGTLLDAVNEITEFSLEGEQAKVNQPLDRSEWSTTTRQVNAYYNPMDNSINILAGILAGGLLYSTDAPCEENLSRIGMVIGHEITHAFDTTGYLYDKDGHQNSWWTKEDEEAFRLRSAKVAKYYSALEPLAGASYNGEKVQGEAIADMGGLKCALALGEKRENFDTAAFFRSYAFLWKTKRSYMGEISMIDGDEHPVGFLRTNVTVQQFDEFLEAFDIQKGDGMYLDPKDRILVW